jgi:SAM-dependent methyltransferase
MTETPDWAWACPQCRGMLAMDSPTRLLCPACGTAYEQRDGIWHLMSAERVAFFETFLDEYTRIRRAEGRGGESSDYYRRLPQCDPSHPIAWQWRIRQKTYAMLSRRVLPGIASRAQGDSPLRILDLGAGVGWLSHRLTQAGYRMCAAELSLDPTDGLGAARFFPDQWPRVRAEFDRVPLASGSIDCVIFNASVHYSSDYMVTLTEALRVIRPTGHLIVLESPVYEREEAGRQMAEARHQQFHRQFGTRSDALDSREFLTWGMLDELADALGLRWTVHRPWYGVKWALRPWRARLLRRREPSRFVILVGQRR